MGSLMVAPIISGSMAQHLGWRSFWKFNTVLIAASTLLVIFGFPETKWHRLHPDEVVRQMKEAETKGSPAGSAEKVAMAADHEAENGDLAQAPTHGTMPDLSASETAQRDPHLGKGKPSKAQWRFFQPNKHPFKAIAMDLWIPWKLFAFPIVEFSAFVVSWSCSSFLTLNLTQTQKFAYPPYNLSPQNIGSYRLGL